MCAIKSHSDEINKGVNVNKSIKSIMIDNPVSAHKDNTLEKLKKIMDDCLFSHIPIVNNENQLIGIVSKIDMLKAFWETASPTKENTQKFFDIKVSKIMCKDVIRLKESSDIKQAIDVLMDKSFHSLPIVDYNNKLVGIITTNDLLLELRNYL